MERIGHRIDQQRAFESRERTRRIVTGQQSGGGKQEKGGAGE